MSRPFPRPLRFTNAVRDADAGADAGVDGDGEAGGNAPDVALGKAATY